MLHYHQHVDDSKGSGHCDAEITGDDDPSVILEKGRPTLITARVAGRCDREFWQIFADGARRHPQTKFQQQLVGDPLLAPDGVLARHPANQVLKFGRYRLPTGFGPPAPEKAETLAVPSDEGFGPHHGQSVSPVEPATAQHRRQPGQIVEA